MFTGEIVPPQSYMQEFSTKNFEGLFKPRTLTDAFSREHPSGKIFANTFLFSEEDLLASRDVSGVDLLRKCIERHGDFADRILRSQFVAPESIQFLGKGDVGSFLTARASMIVAEARKAAGESLMLAGRDDPRSRINIEEITAQWIGTSPRSVTLSIFRRAGAWRRPL